MIEIHPPFREGGMQRSFQVLLLSTAMNDHILILMFQVTTTCVTLPVYLPVLHQSKARKKMVPLAHVHLRGADWYLTISWQLSLLAKENKPEFTKTKYVPQFQKVKTSQQILSRDVHWRKNLHVWDFSSKKVGSYMAADSAAS